MREGRPPGFDVLKDRPDLTGNPDTCLYIATVA